MISVPYPEPAFRTKHEGGKQFVFDEIRKLWLLLTEEEWVRQNFIASLLKAFHYPAALIAIEKEIRLNDLKKRFDILVYANNHTPWMMVECKAPSVALSEAVLQQVLRYNMTVPVQYLVITNGTHTIAWEKREGQLLILSQLPAWPENGMG